MCEQRHWRQGQKQLLLLDSSPCMSGSGIINHPLRDEPGLGKKGKKSKALHGRLAGRFKPLWRDGVTILPRPAKKNATAKNNRPVPALEKKKKTPPRSVPSKKKKKPPRPTSEKKKNAPSRLGKKQQPPRPASKKKQTPPRPAVNSKIHRPEGGNWKQIPPPVSFSLFLVAHLYRIVV